MKKFYSWLISLQLLAGAIWCFYYSQNLLGLILFGISMYFLVPKVYKILKNKFKSELKAGIAVSSFIVVFLIVLAVRTLTALFTMPDLNDLKPVLAFENDLNKSTQACFGAYDECFTKKHSDQEAQCAVIIKALNACKSAQNNVTSVTIPESLSTNIKEALAEAKVDAGNVLKDWTSIYDKYGKVCGGEPLADGGNSIKVDLMNVKKNSILMDIKIKKAKSYLGL